jgi:hypothetical protein
MTLLQKRLSNRLATFLHGQDGAVTVDWVVITAATVGLGIASVGAVRLGTGSMGEQINASLSNAQVASILALGRNIFDASLMPDMQYWENPNNPMHAHWFQRGGHLPGWESLHDTSYRMDIMEVRHHPWMQAALGPNGFALDLIGEPGQHLNLQQSHDIPAGQPATISFKAANASNGTMNVYWGNQLLGEYNALPVNEFQSVTLNVTGGAGDGSNMLRFESTGGDGWRGVYLADVSVN